MIGILLNKQEGYQTDYYLVEMKDGYQYVMSKGIELYQSNIKQYGIVEFCNKNHK